MLPKLHFWSDPVERDGPENMAVDEWLAETCVEPVLRIYRWKPGWGSFGYFVKAADLPVAELRRVRRWTGGGIVDHRTDRTYTLFVPRGFGLAEARGGESYRIVHGALAAALREAGVEATLSGEMPVSAGGECFRQPVEHDVLDAGGGKIAGAGQRRIQRGLLHQGSVVVPGRMLPAEGLARRLAGDVTERDFKPDPGDLAERIARRYGSAAWMTRR